jgi:hypothetical protein
MIRPMARAASALLMNAVVEKLPLGKNPSIRINLTRGNVCNKRVENIELRMHVCEPLRSNALAGPDKIS